MTKSLFQKASIKLCDMCLSVLQKLTTVRQQTEEHFFIKLLLFFKNQQEFLVFLPRDTAISTQPMVLGKLERCMQNKQTEKALTIISHHPQI